MHFSQDATKVVLVAVVHQVEGMIISMFCVIVERRAFFKQDQVDCLLSTPLFECSLFYINEYQLVSCCVEQGLCCF